MNVSFTSELAYSYRRDKAVLTATAGASGDSAALATVEQLLVAAGEAYRNRQYNDAIDQYQDARGLLWAQLFPLAQFDDSRSWKWDLIKPLISYGAEWMNVLPVEQAIAGVRPREVTKIDAPVLGLLSAATDAVGTAAVADYELAQTLTARGNAASARFFLSRAVSQAPDLIKEIEAGANGKQGIAADLPMVPVSVPPGLTVAKRTYAFLVEDQVQQVSWTVGESAATDELIKAVYESRVALTRLPDVLMQPVKAADVAIGLAHAWYYETALGLAECYHALGAWTDAETWYLRAAGYQYLNAAIEAPYVWSRLATLYLDWGNAYFRSGDAASALPVYEKVLTVDGAAPATPLYTIPGLKPATDAANNVIANLATPAAITAGPAISAVIFDVQAQLAKIQGGLDFWGHWAQNVPIWTFDYLQSVTVNFCQLAISTERDAMSFWEKADAGELTRVQLTQNVAQSQAELAAVQSQVAAAQAEANAYQAAQTAAQLRATDARANAAEYTSKSWDWTMHQALQAQMGGGEDGDSGELNSLADQMSAASYSIDGDRGTLAAAEGLTAARLQRGYEIDTMNRQADELDAASAQAGQEVVAAQARVTAANAAANAAAVRVNGAQQLVAAFDQQRFTPDVWNALGQRMSDLSQRYLVMALDVAKRMQRAYNFENDVELTMIRPDYASDTIKGLLAADSLMADVQSFTYDLVTSTAPQGQPVKQTISLAQRYPFLFETQLRSTGSMQFQTDLDDFDSVYPGTYAGRIEHVEIAIDGIIPARGVSGTLTNAGISHYRVPAAVVLPGGVKHRVQNRQAQVISDFDPRADALMDEPDRRHRRIFEGAGLASAWTLDLPMDVNQMDYNSLIDVRLTFTYEARYDPDLRAAVLADLAGRPQIHERQRPIPLRWVFADAFFSFYATGILGFALGFGDFAAVETKPLLTGLSLVASTTPHPRAGGLVLTVTAPGAAAVKVTTAADGTVDAVALAAAVTGQSAIGDYRIAVDAADNPGWVTDGVLDLTGIDNIALIVGYSFTPRG